MSPISVARGLGLNIEVLKMVMAFRKVSFYCLLSQFDLSNYNFMLGIAKGIFLFFST